MASRLKNSRQRKRDWLPWVVGLIVLVSALVLVWRLPSQASVQHDHHHLHVFYKGWVNSKGQGCCNNHDCSPIADNDLRTTPGGLELFVRGVGVANGQSEWCPVLAHHYLSKGNAPDWSTAHACIWSAAGSTPCAQFICFQPKPSG